MKKKLLFIAFITLSLTAFSQTLDSDNFNSLTIGDFATDITGETSGQGGFFIFADNGAVPTTTTNAAASNLQVVSEGNNGTQGAQLTTPNGDKGVRFLFKPIEDEWTARTSGNDIVELEFAFFTGSESVSRAPFRAIIFGLNGTTGTNLVGFQFDPITGELFGLAGLTNNGAPGLFPFNLGAANTDLILPDNTWLEMGCSYNTITGEVRWKTSFNDTNVSFSQAANVIPGMVPLEINFLSFGTAASAGPPAVPANNAATNYIFDDYLSRATATDQLLGIDDVELSDVASFKLFPNPANNFIELSSNIDIEAVSITNSIGQTVLEINNVSNNTLDISELNSGLYLITVKSGASSQTKRFIKQ